MKYGFIETNTKKSYSWNFSLFIFLVQNIDNTFDLHIPSFMSHFLPLTFCSPQTVFSIRFYASSRSALMSLAPGLDLEPFPGFAFAAAAASSATLS